MFSHGRERVFWLVWFILVKLRPQRAWKNYIDRIGSWVTLMVIVNVSCGEGAVGLGDNSMHSGIIRRDGEVILSKLAPAFQNHGIWHHLGGLPLSCVSPLPRRPADWRDRTVKVKVNLSWTPSLSASGYPDDCLHISVNWQLFSSKNQPFRVHLTVRQECIIYNAIFTLNFRRSNHH